MTIEGARRSDAWTRLVMVIGAKVFRYYPYVAGDYLPEGTELLQITSDTGLAGAAPVGESILGDSRLALEKLLDAATDTPDRAAPAPLARKHTLPDIPSSPLTPPEVYAALSAVWPAEFALGNEFDVDNGPTAGVAADDLVGFLLRDASGGIGLGVPAAVGVALGETVPVGG